MPDHTSSGAPDRRRLDRRIGVPLAELTLPELRRMVVTSVLFAAVLALFLWMVHGVIIAALLGLVIALYLRPLDDWLTARLRGRRGLAALSTLTVLIVPFVGVALYSYVELLGVARYVTSHEQEIAAELTEAVLRLSWPELGEARTGRMVRSGVDRASRLAEDLPGEVGRSAGGFFVAATIFLFTAFYVLTRGDSLAAYIRSRTAPRYSELVGALESNLRGVLYGAMYASLVTQALKSAVLFVLFLLFDVPLAAVLAVLSFVIGFFPVVGSWSVYLPAAVWLAVFRDSVAAALVVLGVGVLVNTLFISTYLRPRLAADKSHVLDFYWMLVGLVTGVYSFGLAGVVLGPILIGLLKAIVDTVSNRPAWRLIDREDEG